MASRQTFSPGPSLAATARVHARAPETRLGVETRKAIAVFCGIDLIVSLPFGDLPAGPKCGIFLTPRRLH
jgi:hypothetical protein